MISKTAAVVNPTGLHARPASDFVACAKKFSSRIRIRRLGEEKGADAKSIVALLCLGLKKGTEVEIAASGDDEKAAVEALTALLAGGFGET
jgi:phosphocarrier protein HPr